MKVYLINVVIITMFAIHVSSVIAKTSYVNEITLKENVDFPLVDEIGSVIGSFGITKGTRLEVASVQEQHITVLFNKKEYEIDISKTDYADRMKKSDYFTPIQISIWSPIQVFSRDWDVVGFRYGGFYSRNRHVYGLDIGFVNRADSSSGGIQLGLFNTVSVLKGRGGFVAENYAHFDYARSDKRPAYYTGMQLGSWNSADEMRGLQCAGGINDAFTINGLQLALMNFCYDGCGIQLGLGQNAFGDFVGAQIGAINMTYGEMHGLQFGILNFADLINLADKEMHGLQFGILNGAARMHGFQFGIVNFTQKLHGIQVGLLNFITESHLPFLPVPAINAHF